MEASSVASFMVCPEEHLCGIVHICCPRVGVLLVTFRFDLCSVQVFCSLALTVATESSNIFLYPVGSSLTDVAALCLDTVIGSLLICEGYCCCYETESSPLYQTGASSDPSASASGVLGM